MSADLDLTAVVAALERRGAVSLAAYDPSFLALSIHRRLTGLSCGLVDYLSRVEADPSEVGDLLASMRVSFSQFFRNGLTFGVLEQVVVPELCRRQAEGRAREVRVWSAGCAAGQEAYSVAMLLADATGGLEGPLPFRVIATDVVVAELDRARDGLFSAEELATLRLAHLRRYFSPREGRWRLDERLRARVDFSRHDLQDARSPFPPAGVYGDFDLVLCCNVLLYYTPAVRQALLSNLRRGLAADGYLVTGEAERAFAQSTDGYREVIPPVPVFQKTRRTAVTP